jgi:hypothetical protein
MRRDDGLAVPRLARTLVRLALPRDRFEVIDGYLAELFELRAGRLECARLGLDIGETQPAS